MSETAGEINILRGERREADGTTVYLFGGCLGSANARGTEHAFVWHNGQAEDRLAKTG